MLFKIAVHTRKINVQVALGQTEKEIPEAQDGNKKM